MCVCACTPVSTSSHPCYCFIIFFWRIESLFDSFLFGLLNVLTVSPHEMSNMFPTHQSLAGSINKKKRSIVKPMRGPLFTTLLFSQVKLCWQAGVTQYAMLKFLEFELWALLDCLTWLLFCFHGYRVTKVPRAVKVILVPRELPVSPAQMVDKDPR